MCLFSGLLRTRRTVLSVYVKLVHISSTVRGTLKNVTSIESEHYSVTRLLDEIIFDDVFCLILTEKHLSSLRPGNVKALPRMNDPEAVFSTVLSPTASADCFTTLNMFFCTVGASDLNV